MASDREIEQIRKSPASWRLLVSQFLRFHAEALEPKDVGFLESLSERHYIEELSYRQAEWLLDIRDNIDVVSQFRGFSIKYLTENCYLNRFGLDEDSPDLAWLGALRQSGRTSIRRYEARRLYSIAKRLGEIDDWAA